MIAENQAIAEQSCVKTNFNNHSFIGQLDDIFGILPEDNI